MAGRQQERPPGADLGCKFRQGWGTQAAVGGTSCCKGPEREHPAVCPRPGLREESTMMSLGALLLSGLLHSWTGAPSSPCSVKGHGHQSQFYIADPMTPLPYVGSLEVSNH